MTNEQLNTILRNTGIATYLIRTKTRCALPYIVYCPAYETPISSDESQVGAFTTYKVELYAQEWDAALESKVEEALLRAGIVYEKNGYWISEQSCYETLYEFEGVKPTNG